MLPCHCLGHLGGFRTVLRTNVWPPMRRTVHAAPGIRSCFDYEIDPGILYNPSADFYGQTASQSNDNNTPEDNTRRIIILRSDKCSFSVPGGDLGAREIRKIAERELSSASRRIDLSSRSVPSSAGLSPRMLFLVITPVSCVADRRKLPWNFYIFAGDGQEGRERDGERGRKRFKDREPGMK